MKKKVKKSFNARQQKYKENILKGMSKYNAAIAAGYSENTAKCHTKDLDERVAMSDVMERHGLTDKYIVERLLDLLTANKVVGYLHNYKKEEKGRMEKISPDEVVSNEFVEVPDWSARAKGLELVGKFSGKLQDKIAQAVANYTQMTVIQVQDKVLNLDMGKIPEEIKQRMKQ